MPSAARLAALLAAISIGTSITAQAATRIHREPFGKTPDGAPTEVFTLTGDGGAVVRISNYGGVIIDESLEVRLESGTTSIDKDAAMTKALSTKPKHSDVAIFSIESIRCTQRLGPEQLPILQRALKTQEIFRGGIE